jgi:hypothetical protein
MGATEVRQSEASGKFMAQLSRVKVAQLGTMLWNRQNIHGKGMDDG